MPFVTVQQSGCKILFLENTLWGAFVHNWYKRPSAVLLTLRTDTMEVLDPRHCKQGALAWCDGAKQSLTKETKPAYIRDCFSPKRFFIQ